MYETCYMQYSLSSKKKFNNFKSIKKLNKNSTRSHIVSTTFCDFSYNHTYIIILKGMVYARKINS